jgi:hypothetical protein
MNRIESLKNFGIETNRHWHEARLSWAIYWGRIPWAMKEVRALKLNQKEGLERVAEAFFAAASRTEIIYGDPERAHSLQQAGAYFLRRAREPEAVT